MKKIELKKNQILEYQQNRDPYLMIDHAEEVVPGISSKGYKLLSENEWFFKVHWPSDPNMPGLLQIEALVQMSSLSILTLEGNKGKIIYLTSVLNSKFKTKVLPKKKFLIETKILSWKRGLGSCHGIGKVDGKLACEATFNIILPDEINKYKKK